MTKKLHSISNPKIAKIKIRKQFWIKWDHLHRQSGAPLFYKIHLIGSNQSWNLRRSTRQYSNFVTFSAFSALYAITTPSIMLATFIGLSCCQVSTKRDLQHPRLLSGNYSEKQPFPEKPFSWNVMPFHVKVGRSCYSPNVCVVCGMFDDLGGTKGKEQEL